MLLYLLIGIFVVLSLGLSVLAWAAQHITVVKEPETPIQPAHPEPMGAH